MSVRYSVVHSDKGGVRAEADDKFTMFETRPLPGERGRPGHTGATLVAMIGVDVYLALERGGRRDLGPT